MQMTAGKILVGWKLMGIFIGGERYGFQVPNEPSPGQGFEQIVGDVNFPPVKTLADGAHVAVMVVMPALAQGDQRQNQAVPAVVLSIVAAFAQQMRQRVDAGSGMK